MRPSSPGRTPASTSRPKFLAHVSPLGWEHINLTGEYRWPGAGPLAQNTLVAHIIVQNGPLVAPGEWLSDAPHLIRAVLDHRVRIRGIPRHQGIIAAVRAIDNAPLQRRKKLWRTIRGGLGLYDPETLRNEAIKVGLLTTFHERPACTQPELENASQLTLFATVGDERTTNNPAVRLTPKGIAITSRRQHGEQRA